MKEVILQIIEKNPIMLKKQWGKRPYLCESKAQPVFKNSKISRKIVFPRKVLF